MRKIFAILALLSFVFSAAPMAARADDSALTPQVILFVNNQFGAARSNPEWDERIIFKGSTWVVSNIALAPRRLGDKVYFGQAEAVLGGFIQLNDGRSWQGCVFPGAPASGYVLSGVVNPWGDEQQGHVPCDLSHPRVTSGDGGTIPFNAGDSVWGVIITLDNGQKFNGCVLRNAPMNGKVFVGVRNPLPGETGNAPNCN